LSEDEVRDETRRLAMFPLGAAVLPGDLVPLHVFEPRYRALVAHCLESEEGFGIVLITRGSEVGGGDERAGTGTEARIERARPFDDGRWALVALAGHPIEVVRWLAETPFPLALVRDRPDPDEPEHDAGPDARNRAVRALVRVRALAEELEYPLPGSTDFRGDDGADGEGEGGDVAGDDTDHEELWRLCRSAPLTAFDRQRLLEASSPSTRAELLAELVEGVGDDLAAMLGRL
jgi:uncharacterized protein